MEISKGFPSGLFSGVLILAWIAGPLGQPLHAQSYTPLHSFTGGDTDGCQLMYGAPALSGSTLFGMTHTAGSKNSGTLFQVGTDGNGYQTLHHFGNPEGDGTTPRGSLTLSGSVLYGFTAYGGSPYVSTGGTLFKIGTDGNNYQQLLTFGPGTFGQVHPYGAPVINGTRLYGMTLGDGAGIKGSVFAMNTDGTGIEILHPFTGQPDGADPYGSLTLVGSRLFGMTNAGGLYGTSGGGSGHGVLFSLNTNGTDYTIHHHFAGFPDDGNNPTGSLTLVGDRLFGMTGGGGKNNASGVLFSIGTDGTGYRVLLDFSDVGTAGPRGALTYTGSRLYGTTSAGGGPGASGTVFTVKTDGNGFLIIHRFLTATGDGGQPIGDLTVGDSSLYGWTYAGGTGCGVVFSLPIPTIQSTFMPSIFRTQP